MEAGELLFNSEFPKTCNQTWQVVGWEECLSRGRCYGLCGIVSCPSTLGYFTVY